MKMARMKRVQKSFFRCCAFTGVLICVGNSNTFQSGPTAAATTPHTTGQPDQGQQMVSSSVQPMENSSAVPTPAPTDSSMQSMLPVTIETMKDPQPSIPTQTASMPTDTSTQPVAQAVQPPTPPQAEPLSVPIAPGQPSATPFVPENHSIPMTSAPTDQSNQTAQQPMLPPFQPVAQVVAPNTPPSTGSGLSVTNPTSYPITLTLNITPGARVIQKDIPAGKTVDLLTEPLNKNDTYTVSGSLFQTIITKTTVTTLSGPAQQTQQPSQFINTKTNRISSTKNWSAANPTSATAHLTVDFNQHQGVEPTFEIRQQ